MELVNNHSNFIPSLYIQNKREESLNVALKLTKAKSRYVIRVTGGCGYMSEDQADGLYDLYVRSLIGYKGAILFGGTRMVNRKNLETVVPGITEIPPLIRKHCPDSVILGIIPKSGDLQLSMEYGLVVSDDNEEDYITIIHPNQDICVVVQQSVDEGVSWEAEFEECIHITSNLREYANWKSLLISYNGGGVTEKEILKTAKLGWPILLIKGSGKKTDEYANDKEFLMKYPNVHVVNKNPADMRQKLFHLEALENSSLVFDKHGFIEKAV